MAISFAIMMSLAPLPKPTNFRLVPVAFIDSSELAGEHCAAVALKKSGFLLNDGMICKRVFVVCRPAAG
jgi:hypothetical protein